MPTDFLRSNLFIFGIFSFLIAIRSLVDETKTDYIPAHIATSNTVFTWRCMLYSDSWGHAKWPS